jgi:hypothetical protein
MTYRGEPVTGVNGVVVFDGQSVAIRRRGLLTRFTLGTGETRIPIGDITAVQWKAPSAGTRGFVQFMVSGAGELKAVQAARNRNSVLVGFTQTSAFVELRDAVEAAIVAR